MLPRKHCLFSLLSVVVLMVIMFPGERALGSIQINSSTLSAYAVDVSLNNTLVTATRTEPALSFPTNITMNAIHGGSQSLNDINWYTNSSGQTVLTLEMNHQRDGLIFDTGTGSVRNSRTGINGVGTHGISFTIVEPTPFLLSGAYEVWGTVDGRGDATFVSTLVGSGGIGTLHSASQSVTQTKDASFSITGAGTEGELVPGNYFWHFRTDIRPSPISTTHLPDDGATAHGFFTLVLGEAIDPGDPGVIPEATSFITWSLLAIAFLNTSRRRRE